MGWHQKAPPMLTLPIRTVGAHALPAAFHASITPWLAPLLADPRVLAITQPLCFFESQRCAWTHAPTVVADLDGTVTRFTNTTTITAAFGHDIAHAVLRLQAHLDGDTTHPQAFQQVWRQPSKPFTHHPLLVVFTRYGMALRREDTRTIATWLSPELHTLYEDAEASDENIAVTLANIEDSTYAPACGLLVRSYAHTAHAALRQQHDLPHLANLWARLYAHDHDLGLPVRFAPYGDVHPPSSGG